MTVRATEEVQAALSALEDPSWSDAQKVDMLVEIAMGLQTQPRQPADLHAALDLYDRALHLSAPTDYLVRARITARRATALHSSPGGGVPALLEARDGLEMARAVLRDHGEPEELAEAEMNLGLVLQSLAGEGKAPLKDAISAYQRALRTFGKVDHPKEFAILQNNLATAFLSMPMRDESGKMREALAVQSFEEGLSAVSLVEHPVEYAMLQNNLGNALQYASSSHGVENNLRALDAYDEALKVRTRAASPLSFANTIANKANCLLNLPDDPSNPDGGQAGRLTEATALYAQAVEIFETHGEPEKARMVREVLAELGIALSHPEAG